MFHGEGVEPWQVSSQDYPSSGSVSERLRFLVRYAILAPSSHNSQPWKFRTEGECIEVRIDFTRWLKVADEDQRELHISIGCAIENLLIAAERFGFGYELHLLPEPQDPSLAATVLLREDAKATAARPAILFDMLPVRHTNHQRYDGRLVSEDLLSTLRDLCVEDEVVVYLTTDQLVKERVDELVVRGDALQFSDPAYREELAYWIGQGVFGTNWLMSKLGKLAVHYVNMGVSQGRKDSAVLMSSPVLGLIGSWSDDRLSQIQTGQVYQRLSLWAASQGVWCQPMSQMVEIPELRKELAALLPDEKIVPQHPFRMGHAAAEDRHSPRRPLEQVLL